MILLTVPQQTETFCKALQCVQQTWPSLLSSAPDLICPRRSKVGLSASHLRHAARDLYGRIRPWCTSPRALFSVDLETVSCTALCLSTQSEADGMAPHSHASCGAVRELRLCETPWLAYQTEEHLLGRGAWRRSEQATG